MGIKGTLEDDHISLNKFTLSVLGMPEIRFTSISGIEEELNKVSLPDRTVASGGRTNPVEMDCAVPAHHEVEIAAMELWFQSGKDPVLPGYKRIATLTMDSITGNRSLTFTLPDCFISKRGLPDVDLDNDGEMATIVYTLSASDMLPAIPL